MILIFKLLVENAPFISKFACAKALHINRHAVASYLYKDKILNHKWILVLLQLI
jgi:hypothetical protein